MSKIETEVTTLKINRGTKAKIEENLSLIGENELIITTDESIPVPTTSDNGKVLGISSGDYALVAVSGGVQLYKHRISCSFTDSTGGRYHSLVIISTRSTAYTGFSSFGSTTTVAEDVDNSSIIAITVGDNDSMCRAYGTIVYAGNMISDFKILVNNVTISLIAFELDTVTEL